MPPKDRPKPPFMNEFIIGSTQNISHHTQIMIEANPSIDHEEMCMKNMNTIMNMNDSDCMHMGQMYHSCHMMDMDHEEYKNDDEMFYKFDYEMNKNHKFKHLSSNHIIMIIDEILS